MMSPKIRGESDQKEPQLDLKGIGAAPQEDLAVYSSSSHSLRLALAGSSAKTRQHQKGSSTQLLLPGLSGPAGGGGKSSHRERSNLSESMMQVSAKSSHQDLSQTYRVLSSQLLKTQLGRMPSQNQIEIAHTTSQHVPGSGGSQAQLRLHAESNN